MATPEDYPQSNLLKAFLQEAVALSWGATVNLPDWYCITDRSYPAAAMPHWQEKK
jgi:hypothetical protein